MAAAGKNRPATSQEREKLIRARQERAEMWEKLIRALKGAKFQVMREGNGN